MGQPHGAGLWAVRVRTADFDRLRGQRRHDHRRSPAPAPGAKQAPHDARGLGQRRAPPQHARNMPAQWRQQHHNNNTVSCGSLKPFGSYNLKNPVECLHATGGD